MPSLEVGGGGGAEGFILAVMVAGVGSCARNSSDSGQSGYFESHQVCSGAERAGVLWDVAPGKAWGQEGVISIVLMLFAWW